MVNVLACVVRIHIEQSKTEHLPFSAMSSQFQFGHLIQCLSTFYTVNIFTLCIMSHGVDQLPNLNLVEKIVEELNCKLKAKWSTSAFGNSFKNG